MPRILAVAAFADAATTQTSNTAAIIALVGVVGAALLTAVGGIVTAVLSRKREREELAGIDKTPADIATIAGAYSDCRKDLTGCQERIRALEAELDETRSLCEFFLREMAGGEHDPKIPPGEPQ